MENKDKEDIKSGNSIKIDYDSIDVADIMDQIKKKVALKGPEPSPEEVSEEEISAAAPSPGQEEPVMEEQGLGVRAKIKKIASILMSPFAPFIKLMVLPVHLEVMDTAQDLHKTNLRLDDELHKSIEYTKLLHTLCHNLVIELSKLKIEEENLKNKTRILEKDFEFLKKRERALEKLLLK